jgi:hypothetical protein
MEAAEAGEGAGLFLRAEAVPGWSETERSKTTAKAMTAWKKFLITEAP